MNIVLVSPRAARLRCLQSFRAVARIPMCPIATQNPMSETAETAKTRKRGSEGEESEVSEKPRVKEEAGEGVTAARKIQLKTNKDITRKGRSGGPWAR